jgi:hypothetical protein
MSDVMSSICSDEFYSSDIELSSEFDENEDDDENVLSEVKENVVATTSTVDKLSFREDNADLLIKNAKLKKYLLQKDIGFHGRVTNDNFHLRSMEVLTLYINAIKFASSEDKITLQHEFKRIKQRYECLERQYHREEEEKQEQRKREEENRVNKLKDDDDFDG